MKFIHCLRSTVVCAMQLHPDNLDLNNKSQAVESAIAEQTKTVDNTHSSLRALSSGDEYHLGKHLFVFGAHESVDQNADWHWDPIMYYLGDFNGKTMDLDSASGPHRSLLL